jgi:hypothetical protein
VDVRTEVAIRRLPHRRLWYTSVFSGTVTLPCRLGRSSPALPGSFASRGTSCLGTSH